VQWVSKVRKEEGDVDADLFIYINNFRPTAPDEEEYWRAAQKAGSTLNYPGLQEAPCKYHSGIMIPEPWAGLVAYTNEGEVHVFITNKKWDKEKGIIRELVCRRNESR
jgi:hypothetical protein